MEAITKHSISRASEEAVKLWALASAQYPKQNRLIQDTAITTFVEAVSAFALNARRAMELLPQKNNYPLKQPRWDWAPIDSDERVNNLRDALNRIIHAKKLVIGFELLPPDVSVIEGGAIVVLYIKAATDRKKLSFIDPFSLAHAYLYDTLPELIGLTKEKNS